MGGGAWVREASAESRVHSGDLGGTRNSSGELSKWGITLLTETATRQSVLFILKRFRGEKCINLIFYP